MLYGIRTEFKFQGKRFVAIMLDMGGVRAVANGQIEIYSVDRHGMETFVGYAHKMVQSA